MAQVNDDGHGITAQGGGIVIYWRRDGALFAIEGTLTHAGRAREAWNLGAQAAGYGGTSVPLTEDEKTHLRHMGLGIPVLDPSFDSVTE